MPKNICKAFQHIFLWIPKFPQFLDQKIGEDADLLGLNCFVPDWRIPGHEAERRRTKALDELLESL